MKVFKFLSLLCLIPLLLNSCKDDEPQYLGEFRLGAEGESYIKFEPGSYWVYENDKTGEIDSVSMIYYQSNIRYFEGNRNTFHREDIAFQWRGSKTSYYSFRTVHPFVDSPDPADLRGVRMFNFPCRNIGNSVGMFFYDIGMTSESLGGGVSGQITTLRNKFDSLQVQDKWYYDVVEFEVDQDYSWDERRTKYFWAKNVGLIKREQYMNFTDEFLQSWELTFYNVTQ